MDSRISKDIDGFTLSLASQARNDELVDDLRIKSFCHYQVFLMRLAKSIYLTLSNFNEDSFFGEGAIVKQYLTPLENDVFLVDKSVCDVIGGLRHFLLNHWEQKTLNGKHVFKGEFLYEIAHDVADGSMDVFFNSSFGIRGKKDVKLIKKVMPCWGSIVRPAVLKNRSLFIIFLNGEQCLAAGPGDRIQMLSQRAEGLVREWPENWTFLDHVE